MQIEAGKYYRTQGGQIAGPAQEATDDGLGWPWKLDLSGEVGGAYYRASGECPYLPEFDLMEESNPLSPSLASPDGFLYEFDRDGPPGRRLWQMQPNLPGRWLPQIQDMSTDELRYVAAFIDEEVSR